MTADKNVTSRSYSAYAAYSAQNRKTFFTEFDDTFLKLFLSYVPPEGNILDAGCGTGYVLSLFIDKHFRAMGIDTSRGMLQESALRIPKTKLQLMSVDNITFSDNTFDGVYCRYVVHHLKNIGKGLHELVRVTKPEGIVYISTHVCTQTDKKSFWFTLPNNAGKVYLNLLSKEAVLDSIRNFALDILDVAVTNHSSDLPGLHVLAKKCR